MSNYGPHLVSLSLLMVVMASWGIPAQGAISDVESGSIEERVITLERISNAQAQLMQQLQQQLSDTQNDIDSLRGQIQQNQYQLNQLVGRQKDLYQQIDKLTAAGNNTPPVSGQSGGAADEDVSRSSLSGDPARDYKEAVSLMLEKKQYNQSIEKFQAFVKKYPDSTYQANANYWLGQLSYNQGKKEDAAHYFATVVKKYPKSPKSPDALYKIGLIMQDKGDTAKAKAIYKQVISQYPETKAALIAQKRVASL
mgnify:CR=1 FL=1